MAYDEFSKRLSLLHQLHCRLEPQTALAGERNGPDFRAPSTTGAWKRNPVAVGRPRRGERGNSGAHQRVVMGFLVVARDDELGGGLSAVLMIGAELGESRIPSQKFPVMHAHEAAADRIFHAVFDL